MDMRLRLGLLQDTATMEKQAARAAAEAQAKKVKNEIPTVKTEAQMKADEAAAAKEKDRAGDRAKPPSLLKPKIRPLSETKAIDSGATFVSEGFLLLVGVSLILLENWRSKRKENTRREDVADRISELEESERASRRALVELEKEILRLRSNNGTVPTQRIIPKELWDLEAKEEVKQKSPGWTSWIRRVIGFKVDAVEEQAEAPQPTEGHALSEKPSARNMNSGMTQSPNSGSR